jgi:hypothetical protein
VRRALLRRQLCLQFNDESSETRDRHGIATAGQQSPALLDLLDQIFLAVHDIPQDLAGEQRSQSPAKAASHSVMPAV